MARVTVLSLVAEVRRVMHRDHLDGRPCVACRRGEAVDVFTFAPVGAVVGERDTYALCFACASAGVRAVRARFRARSLRARRVAQRARTA